MTARVLICGGRDYADRATFTRTLDRLFEARGWTTPPDEMGNWLPTVTIIHGACPTGADAMADEYAVVNWCQIEEYPADWSTFAIAEGHPDICIAFPGGRGTADMVRRCRKAGIEVVEVPATCPVSAPAVG